MSDARPVKATEQGRAALDRLIDDGRILRFGTDFLRRRFVTSIMRYFFTELSPSIFY